MTSESARMTTAEAAKFRIDAPNSRPRAIKLIALDAPSERVVKALAQSRWNDATFFTASAFAGRPRQAEPFSMTGWLSDLAGRTKDLIDEVDTADLILICVKPADAPVVSGVRPQGLITQVIDETKRVTLGGNTRPEANHQNDRGPVIAADE